MSYSGEKVKHVPAPPPGKLGKAELYSLSIGQVIGAGIITLIGPAVAETGQSTWLAYLVAIILGFLLIMPILFLTSTLRLKANTLTPPSTSFWAARPTSACAPTPANFSSTGDWWLAICPSPRTTLRLPARPWRTDLTASRSIPSPTMKTAFGTAATTGAFSNRTS